MLKLPDRYRQTENCSEQLTKQQIPERFGKGTQTNRIRKTSS